MVALVLKVIDKLYNIGVLAHLENVNFSSLLVYLDDFHVSLSRSFYSNSFSIKEVSTLQDLAELSLPDRWAIECKEVLNFGLLDLSPQSLRPSHLIR